MRRRLLLAWPLAAVPTIAALTGCGFELRKAPDFAFDSILVPGVGSAVGNDLRRSLSTIGTLRVLPPAAAAKDAQVICEITQEAREKVVVGLNASGQVREFQLRLRVRFQLRTPTGKELIPNTELLLQRDISFNESAVLAKEAEETVLYRDMQNDLVQQLIRRLAAVKTI